MRIAVVSQIRPGSSLAHAINVIKTAGGFARLGHHVTLYTLACEAEHPADLYHEPDLRWVAAPALDAANLDECFGRWAANAIAADAPDLVYARNFVAPLFLAERGIPVVVETHAHVGAINSLLDRTLHATHSSDALRAIITIAPILRDHYIARGGRSDRIHVVPDGVDIDLFTTPQPAPWPTGAIRAVYAGHLFDYKGIPTILDAAALMPHVRFEMVGGLPGDIERARQRVAERLLPNVAMHGHVPHARVPAFVQHADVLLLPPSAREASRDWTSPVKLGEYLATGVPIACSSIPALTRVLREPLVRFCTPDDASSLADAIERSLLESPDDPARHARIAHARTLSYAARAGAILNAATSTKALAA
ncbi:MAG: glycosyltransferase [Phycisphaerales bacterium]|nr:glycosyltransferase [Phycisphaerales bacterium]